MLYTLRVDAARFAIRRQATEAIAEYMLFCNGKKSCFARFSHSDEFEHDLMRLD